MEHNHEEELRTTSPLKPLTKQEIRMAAQERLAIIDKEFKEGFKFIENYPKSVTFFGSSRCDENNVHYKTARQLAHRISKLGFTIVTGGGPGIMEAANRGAFEAGGQSIGLSIKLPNEQKRNKYLTDGMEFYYFFSRKVTLSFAAEAYIFFPGGFGTLNELFEVLTLLQTKKIPLVPVFLIGRDFWGPLNDYIYKELFIQHQAIHKSDIDFYNITDDDDLIIKTITETPVITGLQLKPQF